MEPSYLQRQYARLKPAIIAKFASFNKILKNKNKVKKELVFCLLTPQSKAEVCWRAVEQLFKKENYYELEAEEIASFLEGVRFKNNKARYVKQALEKFDIIYDKLFYNDSKELRRWLVKNVKGMGCKEASHFLRNIGKGDNLAILDRHVLQLLKNYRVISTIPSSISCKQYEAIELKMKEFASFIGVPLHHLDFVFWMEKTGRIFK